MGQDDMNSFVKDQVLTVNYHKDLISTMQIISHSMEKVEISDINIKELPIEDIVKGIYLEA